MNYLRVAIIVVALGLSSCASFIGGLAGGTIGGAAGSYYAKQGCPCAKPTPAK